MTPLDLITKGQWDHALFTTYALSLSFYETQLHKLGLARNGCRDIRIVADVDGYQLSLSERQSHRVGNEYRLTPAALPNGVFHPKLTWLSGKDLDLILLGSGNLTFGGFGKNLECLDVVRSDQNPAFFSQVGDLLEAWAAREDLQFPEADWLETWKDRAERLRPGTETTDPSAPVLLHSTLESIGDQLLKRVGAHGDVVEVRSLSPFFDPNGDGILSFSESLLAPKLTVGLLPGREDASTFPFTKNRNSSVAVQAAVFSAPDDRRRLHAKVLEICMEDGSAFLMTGSVNATRKSLMTSDNIETAVLRHYPSGNDRPFQWEPTDLPSSFRQLEFQKAGLGNRVVVSGRLTGEGKLEGRIISRKDPAGNWDGTLQRIDGETARVNINVGSKGLFSCPLDDVEAFQFAPGLQLHLAKEERSGSGWVSVEGLLMAAKRGFLNPSTLLRLLGSDADEGDETELLRYLASSAQRHLPAFHSERRASPTAEEDPNEEPGKGKDAFQIPIELLSGHGTQTEGEDPTHRREHDAMLNNYMRRIRQNLLRIQNQEEAVEEVDDADDDRASKREEKEREQKRKQLSMSLAEYRERLAELSTKLSAGPARSAALCMWFEATLAILLRRLNEPDEAELFLKQWLNAVLSGQRDHNSSQILSRHVIATLLTLAAAQIQREVDPGRILGRLHEQLEIFCDGEPIDELCQTLELLDPDHPPFAAELLKALPSAPPLDEALRRIQAALTIRQQLDTLLESSGKFSSDDLPILGLAVGKSFADQVSAGRSPSVKRLSSTSEACPHCHIKLRQVTRIAIERDRFGTCLNCNGFLLPSI